MFKKREKVVYPRHGAGKIIDKYEAQVNGEKNEYYKIEFFNSPINLSVPIENAREMGLRNPVSKYKLRKALKGLWKRAKITDSTMKSLDDISKEKLASGEIEDAVSLVNILKSLARKKEEESKNFSYSASQRLETAISFISSEVELVLGRKALSYYDLDIK